MTALMAMNNKGNVTKTYGYNGPFCSYSGWKDEVEQSYEFNMNHSK